MMAAITYIYIQMVVLTEMAVNMQVGAMEYFFLAEI